MGAILQQAQSLKRELTPKLKQINLQWPDQPIKLGFNGTVDVCVPASVTVNYKDVTKYDLLFTATTGTSPPLFLPVSKLETWDLAQYLSQAPEDAPLFPLTSKVLDSTYKDPNVKVVPHHGGKFTAGEETDNFVKYADYLLANGATANKLFSGAIKLWILSNVKSARTETCPGPKDLSEDPSVNYGMYNPAVPLGRIQGAASCHDNKHFDYSQILQLMRNFQIFSRDFDLDIALLTAHPAVWNEGAPYSPTKTDLKYLAFPQPLATNSPSTTKFLAGKWSVKYAASDESYVFTGKNSVSWSNGKGGTGPGFWTEKNKKIYISWRNTGSVEVWPADASTTSIATALNFLSKGIATKLP